MANKRRNDSLSKRLKKFDTRSQIIHQFNPFQTRDQFGCPLRMVVNTYAGCSLGCYYCYGQWMPDFCKPRPKKGFSKKLQADLELIQKYRLENLPISISNSTDPFQPLEETYHHTQKLLEELTARNLKLILITKDPSPLLTGPYLSLLDPSRVYIQVSIPFLYDRPIEPKAVHPVERIKAVKKLVQEGFQVAIRIDPLIPNVTGIKGQSEEEIHQLVEKLQEGGVGQIISKSLRLVGAINKNHPHFYQKLKPFFKENGKWQNNCYELGQETKAKLMLPVYEACQQEGLQLSTCYEQHDVLPEVSGCDQAGPIFVQGSEDTIEGTDGKYMDNEGGIDAR